MLQRASLRSHTTSQSASAVGASPTCTSRESDTRSEPPSDGAGGAGVPFAGTEAGSSSSSEVRHSPAASEIRITKAIPAPRISSPLLSRITRSPTGVVARPVPSPAATGPQEGGRHSKLHPPRKPSELRHGTGRPSSPDHGESAASVTSAPTRQAVRAVPSALATTLRAAPSALAKLAKTPPKDAFEPDEVTQCKPFLLETDPAEEAGEEVTKIYRPEAHYLSPCPRDDSGDEDGDAPTSEVDLRSSFTTPGSPPEPSDLENSDETREEPTRLYASGELLQTLLEEQNAEAASAAIRDSVQEVLAAHEASCVMLAPPQQVVDQQEVDTQVSVSRSTQRCPQRRRNGWVMAVVGFIGVLAASAGAVVYSPQTFGLNAQDLDAVGRWANAVWRRPGVSQPAPVQAKMVAVSIRANPREARMFLDGEPIANPYQITRASDGRKHDLWIEAPGHVTMSRVLTFERDLLWVLTLDRAEAAAPSQNSPGSAR